MRKYILVIVLIVIAVYANAPRNDFAWDDEFLIIRNPSIMSWKYAWMHFASDLYQSYSNYFRPIQMVSYMVDFSIWHLNPFGYHLTNIFLHMTGCILVFIWLLLMGAKKEASLICTLLYAIHPAHTAIVTYIAGRADSLALIFMISCFIFLHKHFLAREKSKSIFLYVLSILCFLAALMSKEISLMIPLLVIFYVPCFIRKEEAIKSRNVIKFHYISWFAIVASIYIILRLNALNFLEVGLFESKYSLYSRILTFIKTIGIYLGIIFCPKNLYMERSIQFAHSIFDIGVAISIILIIFIFFFTFKIRRVSKGAFFGVIFFFVSLLPISNVIPMGSNIAEHWLYVPLVGLTIFFSFYGGYIWYGNRIRRLISFIVCFYLVFFAFRTVVRNFDWYNEWTIYSHTIRYAPQSIKMLNNIGNLYYEKGNFETALKFHKKAVAVNPKEYRTRVNLGIDYEALGLRDEAMRQYQLAIKYRPDYSKAYFNLGNIYAGQGESDQAIDNYKIALKYDDLNLNARVNLGNIYYDMSAYDDAKREYEKALDVDSYSPEARKNLAKTHEMLNEYAEALKEYHKLIDLYPQNFEYYFDIGTLYGRQGRYDKAIKELKKAHSLKPKNVDTLLNIGSAYFYEGDFYNAKREWEKVLRIDPANKTAVEYIRKLEVANPR